jgi:PAS domain S-box-containing protein
MPSLQGRMHTAASKLISAKSMDTSAIMKQASEIFQSVSTLDSLLQQFSQLLENALNAKELLILSLEDSEFKQSHPKNSANPLSLPQDNAIADMLRAAKDTVCTDSLLRVRETTQIRAVESEMNDIGARMAVGIFSKGDLSGILLVGSKIGRGIYDKTEQDALQILCNQFAVALDNAQMYTEMQDSKIRNEILLDQLVSGVIVASPERKITLINHEAQRIIGLKEEQATGKDIDLLPKSIFKALETTLDRQSGMRHVDASLSAPGDDKGSTHIRMGSAYLLGHDQKPMGALLVFTDMTELKTLEEQVRRSDQLSSVGTLAAGMAHEIKNPLVTIKTFTQLLPERYTDADFRNEFASLVADEVSRIDSIVNQLLSFSKPSKPHLVSMPLRATIEKTLKLIHEQLVQKNIKLETRFLADEDLVSGDADLLTQALVNLNLNAIEAIGSDGTITVGTTNVIHHLFNGHDGSDRAAAVPCIRLHISDSGKGIAQDLLKKIFDPFFTSKSEGTGMGLSVAHGIIQEHHGAIEVESVVGAGATFYIYIPLHKEEPPA